VLFLQPLIRPPPNDAALRPIRGMPNTPYHAWSFSLSVFSSRQVQPHPLLASQTVSPPLKIGVFLVTAPSGFLSLPPNQFEFSPFLPPLFRLEGSKYFLSLNRCLRSMLPTRVFRVGEIPFFFCADPVQLFGGSPNALPVLSHRYQCSDLLSCVLSMRLIVLLRGPFGLFPSWPRFAFPPFARLPA